MRHQIKSDESAPIWLTTLADMNTLLMVFWILLFSLGLQDRRKHARTQEALAALSGSLAPSGTAPGGESDAASLKRFDDDPTLSSLVLRPRGHVARLQRMSEGALLTIGGAQDGFPEGRWELTDAQKETLAGLKEWLRGRRNIIEIRGHTASNLQDSVVLEAEGRFRPFSKEDLAREDRHGAANHSMLSWLRADAVRRFLAEEHPEFLDAVKLPETRLRIRAEGYGRTLSDGAGEAERARNRRIEILLTTDVTEK